MVNGERYRAMLNEFLFPKIEEDDLDEIWFQQDEATCHTGNVTIDLREDSTARIQNSNLRANFTVAPKTLFVLYIRLCGRSNRKNPIRQIRRIESKKSDPTNKANRIEFATFDPIECTRLI